MYILVVDDDPVVHRTWHRVLRSTPLGILDAMTYQEAEAVLEKRGTDIQAIILDVWLEPGCGLDLVPKIRECCPRARVLVASAFLDTEIMIKAQKLGLLVLPKEATSRVLREILDLLTPPHDLAANLRAMFPELTDRQIEVIETCLHHDSDHSAAEALGITKKTLETHWGHMKRRTGLSRRQIINRVAAVPARRS